jgi:GTP-binding protein
VKFVDEVTIEVASGRGGPGCVSFRREIFVPRGGPDGGDGGRGGNVVFKTSTRVHSLLDLKLKSKYKAQDGEAGKTQKRAGADGEDLVIIVPPGTMIKTLDGVLVRDLGPEEEFVFLKGGIGGRGNPFYKSSVNQAPSVAQKGMPGEEATIKLELKLIADVGIIGFPNAGKSTLISRISSAKPKIADYPFTTLIPNLGVVRFNEESNFVVADMPGLIKGAHEGVGLGTRFLKHIERTKCFVHMIDASGLSGRDPVQDFKDINNELEMYDKAHEDEEDFRPLADRTQIVALNKADVVSDEDINKLKIKFLKTGADVIVVSAVTGKNIKELVNRMGEMVFHEDEKSKNQFEIKAEGKSVTSKIEDNKTQRHSQKKTEARGPKLQKQSQSDQSTSGKNKSKSSGSQIKSGSKIKALGKIKIGSQGGQKAKISNKSQSSSDKGQVSSKGQKLKSRLKTKNSGKK